jgi:hypothetical protein
VGKTGMPEPDEESFCWEGHEPTGQARFVRRVNIRKAGEGACPTLEGSIHLTSTGLTAAKWGSRAATERDKSGLSSVPH